MAERNQSVASRTSGHRHKSVAEEPVTSVLKPGEVAYDPENPDNDWDADEEVLAALGYKPEFKREFTLWSTFCVSFAVLGLLPSFASTLYYGMGYAGTAGMSQATQTQSTSFIRKPYCNDFYFNGRLTFSRYDMGLAGCHDRYSSSCR